MTPTPIRSGMPGHFGIRRRSRRSIGRAQRLTWVSDDHDRVEDEHLSRLRAGAAHRRPVPVHVGRRMIVLQTSIYRADGKLAAMMIQTQMVLPRGSATPAGEGGGEA